jgi:hypothetical protein
MNLGPMVKHTNNERLNKYFECALDLGNYILMFLFSCMQRLVMIWAKLLLTKKLWKRSAKFLL